jgi:hypothetical protein
VVFKLLIYQKFVCGERDEVLRTAPRLGSFRRHTAQQGNKQQYYKTKDSYIVFVVLRLHRQLKVVPEGSLLILSKSSIEHAKEPLRRTRFVCGERDEEEASHGHAGGLRAMRLLLDSPGDEGTFVSFRLLLRRARDSLSVLIPPTPA